MNNIPVKQFSSIEQMTHQLKTGNSSNSNINKLRNGNSFSKILESKQALNNTVELKFSKHANERLASRNIDLTDEQLERLESGARKAGEKGISESLIMVDDLAFIVNVGNNTVITAVNNGEEKVFTNIDGAIII